MKGHKEWRAVGLDFENGEWSREEGNWIASKSTARADAKEMNERTTVPYDHVIVERRFVSEPVEVSR